jgi:hypothetical protein
LKNDDAIINGALQSVVVSVFYFQQKFCHSSAQKIGNFLEFFLGGKITKFFTSKNLLKSNSCARIQAQNTNSDIKLQESKFKTQTLTSNSRNPVSNTNSDIKL